MKKFPPAIFLMGPTAAGKTNLAVTLRQHLPCDLISVDSALIYKGMNVGTAKPTQQELQQTPHRLIDILDPREAYSAANFRQDALAAMAEITATGRIPLLVGGTMLYFRALERGLANLPAADETVRAQLDSETELYGLAAMHQRLQEIDPVAAARIHPNDPQRIQRALEIYEISGKTITMLHAEAEQVEFQYRLAKIIIAPDDRSILHQRIESRFKLMLSNGFIDEVERLKVRDDLGPTLPSMRAVGYRQVWEYLAGQYTYDEMVDKGIVATRQFAKRQLTWLRSEQDAVWLDSETPDLLGQALKYIKATLSM